MFKLALSLQSACISDCPAKISKEVVQSVAFASPMVFFVAADITEAGPLLQLELPV